MIPAEVKGGRAYRIGFAYGVPALLSVMLAAGSVTRVLPFDWLETFGFISGAWGVWLQVRESVWNWPVQLVSSALYVVVFVQARLFSDSALNVLYVALYLFGWYSWLHGGRDRSELEIQRMDRRFILAAAAATAIGTAGWTPFLVSVNDSAPFLDALTTVLSLVALFLTARKFLESWWVWIGTNLIYVGLYFYKGLGLTAVLYLLFAAMSVVGLLNWRRLLDAHSQPAIEEPA